MGGDRTAPVLETGTCGNGIEYASWGEGSGGPLLPHRPTSPSAPGSHACSSLKQYKTGMERRI